MYITTAIAYVNGNPHIGHLYEIVVADILSRHHKANRDELVIFQTGSDEHGIKIANTAESLKLTPKQLCARNLGIFIDLYNQLNIDYDNFMRTTYDIHYKTVQYVFQKLKESGDIYLGKYNGWYSPREEKYITETVAKQQDYKDIVSGKPLQKIEEDSYFFKMSKYQDKLIEFYQNNQYLSEDFKNDILIRLKEPLTDLSISRTKLKWGVPLDDKHTCYVWFDALLNYLSGIDYFQLSDDTHPFKAISKDLWENTYHIIGKDIIWFHGVIWIAMLMALDIKIPQKLIPHGFVLDKNGVKMSKTLGNIIDPFQVLKEIPVDTLRFYCIKNNSLESDFKFSLDGCKTLHIELANKVGNLFGRIVNLLNKGKPTPGRIPDVDIAPDDPMMNLLDTSFVDKIEKYYDNYKFNEASLLILELFQELNIWLTKQEPWKIKDNLELKNKILRIATERYFQLAHLLIPIMPTISDIIQKTLNQKYDKLSKVKQNNKKLVLEITNVSKKIPILFPKN